MFWLFYVYWIKNRNYTYGSNFELDNHWTPITCIQKDVAIRKILPRYFTNLNKNHCTSIVYKAMNDTWSFRICLKPRNWHSPFCLLVCLSNVNIYMLRSSWRLKFFGTWHLNQSRDLIVTRYNQHLELCTFVYKHPEPAMLDCEAQ